MKATDLLIAMALGLIGTGAAQSPEPQPQHHGPHFAFESTTHNFGTVYYKLPPLEHRFVFTNDGTEPLVIKRANTSCSCVKVRYDKKPIPPGGTGTITVTYEIAKKEPGVFYKVVEVYSNTVEGRNNLIIKGVARE